MPVVVYPDKCTGCGICLYDCGVDVFAFDAETYKAVVDRNDRCVDCFICEVACPDDAIKVVPLKLAR